MAKEIEQSPEDTEKVRKQIRRLMELLPAPEQNRLDTYLAMMETREQQMAAINSDEQNSKVIQSELELAKKKIDALEKVIDIDNKMEDLYKKIVGQEEEHEFAMQSFALKNRSKRKAAANLSGKMAIEKETLEKQNLLDAEKAMSNTHDEQKSESLGESLDEQD